ncbi:MAG: hypothetical protein ACFFCF_08915 [Promethearchaeota archaeon]
MAETIDRVISDRLEVLSRSIFPINYVFSKSYEFAAKHRDCAMTIATTSGTQVNFTEPVKVHPKLLQREGPFSYGNHLYYVKELRILDSYLVITHDQLNLPPKDDPKDNLTLFMKAIQPYISAVDDIIRRRFGTIVIRISTRDKPLILQRQTVKGKQTLTATELLAQIKIPMELRPAIKEVLFRTKPAPGQPTKDRKKKDAKEVRASFFTLEDGRIILPSEGAIQAQEFVELGKVPYQFENIEGPVTSRRIITSFLQLEHQTVAHLLDEYSELAFLPFFFDLYLEQGGPPIRNVALFNGQLIIGRSPESNVREGEFEIFIAKKGVSQVLSE